MAKKKKKNPKEASFIGCTAANLHEAGRSEYLAHYVFSSFGTSVLVPKAGEQRIGPLLHTDRTGQTKAVAHWFLNALNWITDGVHGHFLCSRLLQHFESNEDNGKKSVYAGLDGLSLKINELTSEAMKEAREEDAKNQKMLEAKKAEEESNA